MTGIKSYEQRLSQALLNILQNNDAVVYGADRVEDRVPTISFNLGATSPAEITSLMATRGIGVRDGHMYAPRLMARLGLSMDSGTVRASLLHYNHVEEVEYFGEVLRSLVRRE
jgi:selenocysteine lyase/cysteine desulfurase